MNFLEKLDFLMDRFSLNKRSLSINSDIPYTTIDNWYKRGYEGLKLPTLRKLAEYFNTTLDYWILDEITDPNYGKSSGFKVEYNEMEHIKKYRFISTHSPDGASVVDTVLDRECSIAEKLKEQNEKIVELTEVPRYVTEDKEYVPMMPKDDPRYVNAAHADDYANAPEELKQLEEDIMDDENF